MHWPPNLQTNTWKRTSPLRLPLRALPSDGKSFTKYEGKRVVSKDKGKRPGAIIDGDLDIQLEDSTKCGDLAVVQQSHFAAFVNAAHLHVRDVKAGGLTLMSMLSNGSVLEKACGDAKS